LGTLLSRPVPVRGVFFVMSEAKNIELLEAAEHVDLERVRALLADGASAAFVYDPPGTWGSKDRRSALHCALKSRSESGEVWFSVVEALVNANADVNASMASYDWRGCGEEQTAFDMVLTRALRDSRLLEMFLTAGADANTKSVREVHSMRTDGTSTSYVLHKAVAGEDLEVARALLDASADVNSVASDIFDNERGFNQHTEETALHIACRLGSVGMVALLIAKGAQLNAVRKELIQEEAGLESPTDDPREEGFVSSVVCVPVEETALHVAIGIRNTDIMTVLVCSGAHRDIPKVRGRDAISPEELCGGDEALLRALRAEWSPEQHHLFPPDVRERVKAALLIAQRQQWNLPDTVLFQAFAMASGLTEATRNEDQVPPPPALMRVST